MKSAEEIELKTDMETRVQSTDEQDVVDGVEEVRTGNGSATLIRGGEDKCPTDETSRKGKGKGNASKGEHRKK